MVFYFFNIYGYVIGIFVGEKESSFEVIVIWFKSFIESYLFGVDVVK